MGAADESTIRAYEDEVEASFWDSLAESGLSRAERRAFEFALPRGRARTLVVGCGTGRESLAVSRMGVPTVGIDLSRRLVAEARAHSPGPAGIQYAVAEASSLPFRDGSFDLVLMIAQLLGHLPSRALRRRALTEGRRLLSRDGVLLASAYNRSLRDCPLPYLLWRAVAREPTEPGPSGIPRPSAADTALSTAGAGFGGLKGVALSMWRARALRARVAMRAVRRSVTGRRDPDLRDFYVHPHSYEVSPTPRPGLSFYHIHTREEFLADARAVGLAVTAVFSVRELSTGGPFPALLRDIDFLHYYLLRRAAAPRG